MTIYAFCALAFASLTFSVPTTTPADPIPAKTTAKFNQACNSKYLRAIWLEAVSCGVGISLDWSKDDYDNPNHYDCCLLKPCRPLPKQDNPGFTYTCTTEEKCSNQVVRYYNAATSFESNPLCSIASTGCCTVQRGNPPPIQGYNWEDPPLGFLALYETPSAGEDVTFAGQQFPPTGLPLSFTEEQIAPSEVQVSLENQYINSLDQFSNTPDEGGISVR